MMRLCLTSLLFLSLQLTFAQSNTMKVKEYPDPVVVFPGENGAPPSDAIVLFDGKDNSHWEKKDGSPIGWDIIENALEVKRKTGGIYSKKSFGSIQLHLEWRAPTDTTGKKSQQRGNSGVYLQSMYEVQILDSYHNKTYPDGQAASIYKQYPPLVNACFPPGQWQTYDIVFHAPEFDSSGMEIKPGYLTVLHNGVLVQYHSKLKGPTQASAAKYPATEKNPIMLQDHGNPVRYRNIWVREL
jgi:hypothetical protein